jgi:hypothetical protein
MDEVDDALSAKTAVTLPNPVMMPPSYSELLPGGLIAARTRQSVTFRCTVVASIASSHAARTLDPRTGLLLLGSAKRLRPSKDKRLPFSPAHEREIEPFFWSRAVKPERNYKKTHALGMSNDNRRRKAFA